MEQALLSGSNKSATSAKQQNHTDAIKWKARLRSVLGSMQWVGEIRVKKFLKKSNQAYCCTAVGVMSEMLTLSWGKSCWKALSFLRRWAALVPANLQQETGSSGCLRSLVWEVCNCCNPSPEQWADQRDPQHLSGLNISANPLFVFCSLWDVRNPKYSNCNVSTRLNHSVVERGPWSLEILVLWTGMAPWSINSRSPARAD